MREISGHEWLIGDFRLMEVDPASMEFCLILLALMELSLLMSFLLIDINYSAVPILLHWTASRDPVDGVFDGCKPSQNKASQPLI